MISPHSIRRKSGVEAVVRVGDETITHSADSFHTLRNILTARANAYTEAAREAEEAYLKEQGRS